MVPAPLLSEKESLLQTYDSSKDVQVRYDSKHLSFLSNRSVGGLQYHWVDINWQKFVFRLNFASCDSFFDAFPYSSTLPFLKDCFAISYFWNMGSGTLMGGKTIVQVGTLLVTSELAKHFRTTLFTTNLEAELWITLMTYWFIAIRIKAITFVSGRDYVARPVSPKSRTMTSGSRYVVLATCSRIVFDEQSWCRGLSGPNPWGRCSSVANLSGRPSDVSSHYGIEIWGATPSREASND